MCGRSPSTSYNLIKKIFFISILFGCTTGHVAWPGVKPELGMEPHQSSWVSGPGMEMEPPALGVLTTGRPGRSPKLIFRVERVTDFLLSLPYFNSGGSKSSPVSEWGRGSQDVWAEGKGEQHSSPTQSSSHIQTHRLAFTAPWLCAVYPKHIGKVQKRCF